MRTSLLTCILLATYLTMASGCGNAQSSHLPPARAELLRAEVPQHHVDFVTSYANGLAEANRSGKPLLVFFSTAECIFCDQMLDESFRDQQVVHLSEQFVCVRVEAGSDPEICRDFHIEAFPTVQFIASDGVRLHRLLGKKEPEALASQMQVALQGPHVRTAFRSGVSQH